jgi:hypothetical protein
MTGALTDLREGDPGVDDPRSGEMWARGRTVRADVLAELLTQATSAGRPRALRLAGARIIGTLDLGATRLLCPVLLLGCWFEQPVNLTEARTLAVRLPGCQLPGLQAAQVTMRGNLELNDGFTARGEVSLLGARISGWVNCTRATLTNPSGLALNGDRLAVGQSMFCSENFAATGEVRLGSAHIGGRLSLVGASLRNASGPALSADGLTVDRDVFCSTGFTAHGEVRLAGAHIGGSLVFDGAALTNRGGPALSANRLTVEQSMFCREKFTATGEVRLRGAQILGGLEFDGAILTNDGGCALAAARLGVGQDLKCGNGFTALGEIHLVGAHIGGDLDFGGAVVTNHSGPALYANRITVGQSLFCRDKFTATGEVRLLGAHIGGRLTFATASLSSRTGLALQAERLTVGQDLFFTESFGADGEIRLAGARVGGNADFTGSRKLSSAGLLTLNLTELQAASLVLRALAAPPDSADLTSATIGRLADEPASWPGRIRLRGFTYNALDELGTVSASQRLSWLASDPDGYAPQPYEQLAAVYRRAGRDQDARQVAIAKQRVRRRTLAPPGRIGSVLLDVLVGYGYRTWLAGVWLLGWWAVGTLVFAAAYPHHLTLAKPGAPHPAFQPAVYALDMLLPVVDLDQQANWIPQGAARWFGWASILAGWILTTAVLAAITGVARRD